MAPAKSDQNCSIQGAPPPQDQTDQIPTPRTDDTEHAKRPAEQQESIAIMRPLDSTINLTAQQRAHSEESMRFALSQPLPGPDDVDIPDGPLTKPYDAKTSTYDFAKPEVRIQEKGEGNGNGHNSSSIEQEESIAINWPGDTPMTLTAQEIQDFDEHTRLARYQPLPDPNEDDFPDAPIPKPYDPETSTYEWAKPKATIQDIQKKESEGNGNHDNSVSVEQEECIAIITPGDPSITPQKMAEYEKDMLLALQKPLPGPDEDDFAHLPPTKPYDPNIDNTYEWAKPEAYIQEKDSEGRNVWRNRFTGSVRYSRPWGVPEQDENRSIEQSPNDTTMLIPKTTGQKEWWENEKMRWIQDDVEEIQLLERQSYDCVSLRSLLLCLSMDC